MIRKPTCLAVLALSATLVACAGAGGEYPSLAIRDVERVTGNARPVEAETPPPPPPLAAETGARIAQAVEKARTAHGAFSAGTPGASRAVAAARGAQAPADVWVAAYVALAGLQSLRSEAVIAQADLDLMYAQERLADPARVTPTAQALAEARDSVAAWVEEEDRTIARLASQLRS